jgi:uncharacterized membrane protein
MAFDEVVETVGKAVDVVGVIAIIAGGTIAVVAFARNLRDRSGGDAYRALRASLGRSILLGLEILVAADIIRTVAATPTFQSVGVLAGIVLIRTFLSFSLEVELEGRFPGVVPQRGRAPPSSPPRHRPASPSSR